MSKKERIKFDPEKWDQNCLTINVDASFCPNTGAGGYAFWIRYGPEVIKGGGQFLKKQESAHKCEMYAIANGIHIALKSKKIGTALWLVINTDCKNAIREIINKQYQTAEGKVILKSYQELQRKLRCKYPEFRYVRAHGNNEDARGYINNWCDEEAKKHMRLFRQKLQSVKLKVNVEEIGVGDWNGGEFYK